MADIDDFHAAMWREAGSRVIELTGLVQTLPLY
jgi:hypothetical protein